MPKRRILEADTAPSRRSTHACHRCKSKKIKCRFGSGPAQSTCLSCLNSSSDCVFDVTPDGIPKGAEYVAALETRLAALERQLRASASRTSASEDGDHTRHHVPEADLHREPHQVEALAARNYANNAFSSPENHGVKALPSPSAASQMAVDSPSKVQHKIIESMPDGVNIFNFILHPHSTPMAEHGGPLPKMPPTQAANFLLQTAYFYTQARYCIADWARVHSWHERRQTLCYAAANADSDTTAGAYFLWMAYALGAQLAPSQEHSPEGYYARALLYLPSVLALQNLTSVQALLTLIQYFYRGPGGPSMWNLVGATMRLCIELGLHRKVAKVTAADNNDPYVVELQKRFFWCAYCFDRSVSILSKRPFGIHDADIDVEIPVDVEATCRDQETIREQQIRQETGERSRIEGYTTSMTSSLQHLQIYRLQSRIATKFTGPRVAPPSPEDTETFLAELDLWISQATEIVYPPGCPQQSIERVWSIYYLTGLILMRPILNRATIDDNLVQRCAILSAGACDNEKAMCFSPQTHNSPIRIYNCFRSGLTLLQCLVAKPGVIPVRKALRAINSCSSALAVYTGALAVARPYLQLFERLSYYFLGYDDQASLCQADHALKHLLHRVTSCDPSEIPELLKSIAAEETQQNAPTPLQSNVQSESYDLAMDQDAMQSFNMDMMVPFELLEDSIRPDAFQRDMMNFWSGSSF